MIGIIGAGISGLTLAYELKRRNVPFELWEASGRSGGFINTERDGPYLFELGPNSILIDDDTEAFIRQVTGADELLPTKPVSKARFIYRDGAYRELPTNPLKLVAGSYFSWQTKLSLLREWRLTPAEVPNETLASFFRRRFTKEVVDYALTPFVSGIYFGDPRRLLVDKTFPTLATYERGYGSVLRGLAKERGQTARRRSYSFREGMQTLPRALAKAVGNIFYKHYVTSVERDEQGFLVEMRAPDGSRTVAVDKLVVCAPPPAAAVFLERSFPDLAGALQNVDCPPMVAVHTAYKRAAVSHPLNGFGGLHPKIEKLFSGGSIWSSSVFEGRCPDDEVLFTTFVGGKLSPQHLELPEEEIMNRVHLELKELYGVRTSAPEKQRIAWWPSGIPQYDVNINPVYAAAEAAEARDLYACANWKDGVSLTDCIRKARTLAGRLAG
ncbi:MAG: protoporphyrinogen oxidase [Catalinimonas sp.]